MTHIIYLVIPPLLNAWPVIVAAEAGGHLVK